MADPNYIVPNSIRDAAKHGELVVFVGAGVSVLCGSPNWDGFANAVIDIVGKPAKLSFLEIEQLRGIADPRRRLSIAIDLADEADVPVNYEGILHPSLGGREAGLEAYRLLSALNPVFITTNYDKWFDTAPPPALSETEGSPDTEAGVPQRKIVVGRGHLNTDLLFNRGAVFHLHGRCTDPSSMVISLRDYISHYSDPQVVAFLREVFSKWTVLFVGYGLQELEILEYVVRAAEPEGGAKSPGIRHHILYPFRTSESAQTRFIERYFEQQCRVGVIKYKIDDSGWEELLNVLKDWQPQIDVRDASVIEMQHYLNRCIEAETDPTRRTDAIRLIRRRAELQPYFFNSVSDPLWLEDLIHARLFDPANNAAPVSTVTADGTVYNAPRWAAVGYLERISGKVVGRQALSLIELVRSINQDAQRRGIDNWSTNWSLARVLASIDLDVIEPGDTQLVRFWLESNFNVDMIAHAVGNELLPRLLQNDTPKNKEIALAITGALTQAHPLAAARNRHMGVVGDYYVREMLHKSAVTLGRRIGLDAVRVLSQSLKNAVGTPDEDARSYWRRSAIEEHEQDQHHDNFVCSLIDGVRDASLGCITERPADGREIVVELLRSPYATLRRVGIFLCGEKYGDVGDLFWSELDPAWFGDLPYWHEVYWFLRKGFSKLSAPQRVRYLEVVDAYRGDWKDESRREELDAQHRRDLLHPAQGQGDAEIDTRYARLVEQCGQPREHIDFHIYSKAGWVGEDSPITAAELMQMTPDRLLEYLREFQPEGGASRTTKRGLADALAEVVRADHEAYASRLLSFVDMPAVYQHGLLDGLKQRWSEKKDIDWTVSLAFVAAILESPAFTGPLRADDGSSYEPSARWVANDVLDLVDTGISDDERAMPSALLPSALAVATTVISLLPPNPATGTSQAVIDSINNPRGRALELVIRLLLHASRTTAAESSPPVSWNSVSDLFDGELETSEVGENADFAAHAGVYISNLHYLAPEWVEQNFDRLFSTTNDHAWSCAAQGFAYQRYTYDWLYDRLKSGGHLDRMIADETLPDSAGEKALQFIALAYLAGREPLTGGGATFFPSIIEEMKPEVISRLCWFLWSIHDSIADGQEGRVRDLWVASSRRITGNEASHTTALSSLNLLASCIQHLDSELVDAWKQAAPYAREAHHDHQLVEELARLSPSYPAEVGEVFLAALQGFVPTFDEDHIISCVRAIARGGQAELAERICNAYAEKGSTLLHQTYLDIRSGNLGNGEPSVES